MEVHHKNKPAVEVPEVKKRQHNSYNCPECNSTFDTNYNLGRHLKDQHQGKTLSPERKIAKMNHDKVRVKDLKDEEEKKKELVNLQDLLVQTGKEKEEISTRLSACNLKVLTMERANEALVEENKYLKVENEKAIKNLNNLDKEYITQIQDLKKMDAQKDHEAVYLKAENEKCNRDIEKLEFAYKEQVTDLKKVIDQKDIELKILVDQRRREGTAEVEQDVADNLQTSLKALVVTENNINGAEKNEDENVNDLVTLAAGKSAGHDRETPQSQPTQKKTQLHCALSNATPGILCNFQCNSKEKLDQHIKEAHQSFPCSDRDCTIECDSLDNLAKHVRTMHTRKHIKSASDLKCNICEMNVQTKSELIDHIKMHKSYKPCKNYALNKCGSESECRYGHVILPPGLDICYKCGVTSSSKTDMIKHIKAKHGNEICHNFLLKRCEFQTCMFSHRSDNTPSVVRISEREMVTPSAPTESDFVDLPTTGPVVRTEERAHPVTPQVEGLQDIIRQVTVQQISMHLEQMLPQLIAQISQSITQMNLSHK